MVPCEFPRCRRPASLSYLGHDICEHHHEMICRAAEESRVSENLLLRKIGLVRNERGQVVSINP